MKKAGDILNLFFNEIQKKQADEYISFHNSWNNIAGDKIGNNTEIKDVIDGKLIIEIDHPGWKQLIKLKELYILKKINKDFPDLKINKITFTFKNKIEINENNTVYNKKIENNPKDINIENKDFSELLKKMSKRSEE